MAEISTLNSPAAPTVPAAPAPAAPAAVPAPGGGLLPSTPPAPPAPAPAPGTAPPPVPAPAPEPAPPGLTSIIPEKFRGQTEQESVQKLTAAYTELERKMSAVEVRKIVPEVYSVPVNETGQEIVNAGDPIYQSVAQAARNVGLSQEQMSGIVTSFIHANANAEQGFATAELAKMGETARPRMEALSRSLVALIGDPGYQALVPLTRSASSVEALEALVARAQGVVHPIPAPAGSPGAAQPASTMMTPADVRTEAIKKFPDSKDLMHRDAWEKKMLKEIQQRNPTSFGALVVQK